MLRRTIPTLPFHIVLLLVALFNAMVGVHLHEARHLREAAHGVQKASVAASGMQAYAADAIASGEQDKEDTHTTCAWCLTHALEAGLAHAAAYQPPPPSEPSIALLQGAATFTAQQVRWPFAARDPPPAQRA